VTRALPPIFGLAGASGALWGAISHDEVVAWSGAGVAVVSAVTSALIPAYHRLCSAVRAERRADRQILIDEVRALARVQIEFEHRIQSATKAIAELEAHVEKVRCKFPLADGSARCHEPQTQPDPASEVTRSAQISKF
jgi:hypothetical protein